MAKRFCDTCHVARMNPNHPLFRQGDIIYYRPEDVYETENVQSFSGHTDSSGRDPQNNDKIKLIMEKLTAKETLESRSTFSNFFDDDVDLEDLLPTKLTSEPLNTMVHILECKDEGTNHLFLESRSSATQFHKINHEVEETIPTKLPTPAIPVVEQEKSPPITGMNWNDYQRLDTIHGFLDDLEYNYPSICTSGAIGKSLEGRDLKIVKISNSDTRNACVWIDAGIHAREWIAPAVATYIANHIATNFDTMPESITNKDWYFLPVVNPDGYEYSHTVDRMWRKNRAWHSGQCVGVDLNRNFSFGWGGKGSSASPTNAFYRGPEPFSEPESAAIRDMLLNAGISFKVYITLHSYGQVIIFPFAFKEELCPDYVRLLEGATAMSKAIYETNGNTYKVGISKDVMYGAAGTSYDFSYGEAGIPFCYLFELRSRQHKFKLPKEEIEETGNEILNSVKALMEFVDRC